MWTSGFYRYKHFYTYKKWKFQIFLEIKLCNCFGYLLHIYQNNVDGFEHDVDSAYGVYINHGNCLA